MPITALATANTTIGPSQYADMAQALAPRFVVDSPTDLQPSYASGTVSLQPGAALAAGTRLRVSGSTSVAIPSVSSGSRTYTVVIRVDWSKGMADAATLVALPTTSVNASSTPNTAMINRIPGVMYDAVVATVTRTAGSTYASSFVDYRMWGGDGGPLRVTDAALDNPGMLDARAGTMISTERGLYTKRRDNDGAWRDVGTPSNPWKLWTPTVRHYGNGVPNGVSGGTVAGLGSGGWSTGRYRVVDGMLDGYVYIQPGATGATMGEGPVTFDLPLACAAWQEDTWSMGHLFTFGYGGDGAFDWHAEALIKKQWTRAMVWANPTIADNRLNPYRAQAPGGGPGTGVPFIAGGFTVGTMTFHINYPVT